MTSRSPALMWLVLVLVLVGCAATGETKPAARAVAPPVEEVAEPPGKINAFTACERHAKRKEILLDTASRRLLQTVCGAALWFDGLFGERDLEAALSSYGRVELSTAYSEFEGSDTRLRFDARMILPAVHERLALFVSLDDEEAFVRNRTEGQALRSRRFVSDRDTFLAGLGFVMVTTDRYQSDFKVGVRGLRVPQAFVQNRFSYLSYSDPRNRVLLRLTPFWNTTDGYGATVSIAFDRALEESFLLRWSNVATKIRTGADWRSAVVLYQNLTGGKALAYEIFIRGATGLPEPLAEYGGRAVYRCPIREGRLFLDFVLGYSWPRDDPALRRAGSADVGVGVEMPFGLAPE